MKYTAWYAIVMGVLILGQWAYFLVTGTIPEFQSAPREIIFHLAAELAACLGLIISGIACPRNQAWGNTGLMVAIGMTAYSIINSFSYYSPQTHWSLISIFAALLMMTIVVIVTVFNTLYIHS